MSIGSANFRVGSKPEVQQLVSSPWETNDGSPSIQTLSAVCRRRRKRPSIAVYQDCPDRKARGCIGWSFTQGFGAPNLLFSLFWHQILLPTSGTLWRAMFLEKQKKNQEREEKHRHQQRYFASRRGSGKDTLGPEMVEPYPDNFA